MHIVFQEGRYLPACLLPRYLVTSGRQAGRQPRRPAGCFSRRGENGVQDKKNGLLLPDVCRYQVCPCCLAVSVKCPEPGALVTPMDDSGDGGT